MVARRNMQFSVIITYYIISKVSKNLLFTKNLPGNTKADAVSMPLYPDYSRKTAGVYLNTATSIFGGSDGISILAYAGGDDFPSIPDLPSRVSD